MQAHTFPAKRPFGVTLIAVLTGIQALAILLGALFIIIGVLSGSGFTAALTALSVVSTALALFLFVFAYALWRLKRWAFWTTVVLQGGNLVASAVTFLTQWQLSSLLSFLLSGAILVYFLWFPHVRQAFGRTHTRVFVKQA